MISRISLPIVGIAASLAASSLSAQTLTSVSITNQTLNPGHSMLGNTGYVPTVTLSPYFATPPPSPKRGGSTADIHAVYQWKTGIVATVFWIGEGSSANNPTSNDGSSWDPNWMTHYGGYDYPEASGRTVGYRPARFVPKQNPFYVALPYNDCVNCNTTKFEASKVVPWFRKSFVKHGQSVCKDHWIAIRYGRRTCYAQWSDCGPFVTDDANYVFGNAAPANSSNGGAGLDLSPAVRDYLGFTSGARCDWRFVDVREVDDGPWKAHGNNNPFSSTWQSPDDNSKPMTFVPKPGSNTAAASVIRNAAFPTSSSLPGLVLHSTGAK